MHLIRLQVSAFRNLKQIELRPAARLNLLFGDNGSGKTSLLESISTLSRGYSFRSRKFTQLISQSSSQFTLFAELDIGGQVHTVGISRARIGPSHFKANGNPVRSAAELATMIPLQVINAQSFQLLEGGPAARRRFLDWLVFHVKHDYGRIWQQYARAVKQRNSLLRRGNIGPAELAPWNMEICRYGQLVDEYREEVLQDFLPRLARLLTEAGLAEDQELSVHYLPGWDRDVDPLQLLAQSYQRDCKLGSTSLGPHKSDIKIKSRSSDAVDLLSRGQQKTLVSALYMAQVRTLQERKGVNSVLLIDDLPSELDRQHHELMCGWLVDSESQLFVTGVNLDAITIGWPEHLLSLAKVFHVKHGEITEYSYAFGANHDGK